MNPSSEFTEASLQLHFSRKPAVEAVVSRFQSAHEQTDSPVRAIHHQLATAGEFAELPAGVDDRIKQALERRGIARLYTHQADALNAARQGKNIVVVTPTASGKTLCYNLPVLDLLLRDPGARAMYLFPTKALAEDQLHEMESAIAETGSELRAC